MKRFASLMVLALSTSSAYARVDHTTFRFAPRPKPSAAPDANACASDLVKNPSKYNTVTPMASIGTYLVDRYTPAMNRFADAEESLVAKTLKNFKTLVADAGSVEAGADIRIMSLFLMVGDVLSRHAQELFLPPEEGKPSVLKVNREALAKFLPGVSRPESDVIADAIEVLYKQPAIYALNDSRMSRFDYVISYIIGIAASNGVRGSREAILADVGTQGLAWLTQIETRLGPTEGSSGARIALGKLAARYPLTSADRQAFVKFYPMWVMQLIVLSGPVRTALDRSTLGFADVARVTDLERRLQTVVGVTGARRLELRKKVADRCRAYAGDALAHFPTVAQLDKAKALIAAVRAEAILTVPEYIGSPYTEISANRLATVNFDLPESQDLQSANVVQSFAESEKTIALASASIDSKSAKERAMVLLDVAGNFLGAGAGSSATDEPLYLAGLRGHCAELLQSYSPFELDAYLNGTIYVGWQSVFYPEYGVATYAHEIGHAASFIGQTTSDGWVLPQFAMTCSQKNHSYLRGNLPGESKRFAQEDFADAFSATVTSRMKAKNGTEVAGLLGPILALENFKGERVYAPELETSSATDPHSGVLGREILYRLGLGEKLPASCEAILLPPLAYNEGDYKTLTSCAVK